MSKSLVAVVGMAVLVAAGAALAQGTKAPAQPQTAAQPAGGMDAKARMGQMDEQIKRMQSLHDKMASARTPEERQKLMEEQRKAMQDGMGMMMQGGGMMGGGGGMGGGMMGQQATPGDPNAQLQMMSKRMDMMQMMMQTMMDQQGMMGQPKAPGAAPKK